MKYEYSAIVTKVIDGDTIVCDIDLGLYTWIKNQRIRLFGINAPDSRSGGEPDRVVASRDYLVSLLGPSPWRIDLVTIKDRREKYGRWLGKLYKDGLYLNDRMVEEGHAERS